MKQSEKEFLLVAFLIALLIGSTLAWLLYENATTKHVAEVIWLPAFLGLTVDRYLKKVFAEEVARDVGPYLFSYEVPEEIRDEVLYARRITVVRRNMEVDLAFQEMGGGCLKLITTNRYNIVNFSDQKQYVVHHTSVWVNRHPLIGQPDILNVEASGSGLSRTYSLSGQEIPVTRNASSPACQFERRVAIASNSTSTANAFLSRTLQFVDDDDEDTLFFPDPLIGIAVRVSEKPADLVVEVLFGHRKRQEVFASPSQAPTLWRLSAAFLHWGAVSVAWRRNHPLVQQESPPQESPPPTGEGPLSVT